MTSQKSERAVERGGSFARSTALAFVFLSSMACPFAVDAAEPSEKEGGKPAAPAWRIAQNDGANCLYFLLRFHQRPISHSQVLSALREADRHGAGSLEQLRIAAGRLGLVCGVYSCGFANLMFLNQPAIVLVESGGLSNAGFVVLLSVDVKGSGDERVLLLDGATASLCAVPLDQFRRQWSGHLLIAESGSPSGLPRAAAFAVALLAFVLVASRRRWFATGRPNPDNWSVEDKGEDDVS